MAKKHSEISHTDKPTVKFIEALKDMINSEKIRIEEVDGSLDNSNKNKTLAGNYDDEFYYFIPKVAYIVKESIYIQYFFRYIKTMSHYNFHRYTCYFTFFTYYIYHIILRVLTEKQIRLKTANQRKEKNEKTAKA